MMHLKKVLWSVDHRKVSIVVALTVIILLIVLPFLTEKKVRLSGCNEIEAQSISKTWFVFKDGNGCHGYSPCQPHTSAHDQSRFVLDNSGDPFDYEIVPNIVHFYRTDNDIHTLTLVDVLCLMGAFHNAKPNKIMVHTDNVHKMSETFSNSQYGKRLVKNEQFMKKLEISYWPAPKHVFGIEFSDVYRKNHVQDVTRIRILRKYGGMFVDNRAFVTRDLTSLRHFEMSALESEGMLSNALIVAHRDSRMLDLWLKSYHHYDPSLETHHLSTHMHALYAKRSTLLHKQKAAILKGNVHSLIGDNGLLRTQFSATFAVEIDPNFGGLAFEPGMGEEYVLTLVEKKFNQ